MFDGRQNSLLHPVEQVSWDDCTQALGRMELLLPTEAQWEYAARAGTTTPWSSGATRDSLEDHANLADRAATRAGATWPTIADWPELDDGYSVHAPVDTYQPNPFGLFNIHGNVWEWCRDEYALYDSPVHEGDGERVASGGRNRVNRGGSFYHTAQQARSAYRNNSAPDMRINHLGLRPTSAVQP